MIAQTLLAKGIAAERLILDEASLNTFQNVQAAVRHYRHAACDRLVVCSDGYHTPRIRMFLAFEGLPAASVVVVPSGELPTLWNRLLMSLREAAAMGLYLIVLLARRRRFAHSGVGLSRKARDHGG